MDRRKSKAGSGEKEWNRRTEGMEKEGLGWERWRFTVGVSRRQPRCGSQHQHHALLWSPGRSSGPPWSSSSPSSCPGWFHPSPRGSIPAGSRQEKLHLGTRGENCSAPTKLTLARLTALPKCSLSKSGMKNQRLRGLKSSQPRVSISALPCLMDYSAGDLLMHTYILLPVELMIFLPQNGLCSLPSTGAVAGAGLGSPLACPGWGWSRELLAMAAAGGKAWGQQWERGLWEREKWEKCSGK